MIHFVGAGCGAPDLITVRGARLLAEADVIIYAGSLVNPDLLSYKKASCRVFNSAEMTLDEVIAVMRRTDAERLSLVRLHTGDPALYGAIREQMDRLKGLSIPFEVCPGVSAFSGAAAALQAEYTLPAVSQSVVITRIAGRTPVPERESIRAFAAHGATMVIFLSAGMTQTLQAELLAGGYAPETPAAIVYKVSWPDEKVLRCTVETLHRTAEENGVSHLALITVGGFLGADYNTSKLYDPAFTTAFRKGKEA